MVCHDIISVRKRQMLCHARYQHKFSVYRTNAPVLWGFQLSESGSVYNFWYAVL